MGKSSRRSLSRLLVAFALGRVRARGRTLKRLTSASRTLSRLIIAGHIARRLSRSGADRRVHVTTQHAVIEVEPR